MCFTLSSPYQVLRTESRGLTQPFLSCVFCVLPVTVSVPSGSVHRKKNHHRFALPSWDHTSSGGRGGCPSVRILNSLLLLYCCHHVITWLLEREKKRGDFHTISNSTSHAWIEGFWRSFCLYWCPLLSLRLYWIQVIGYQREQ